MIEANVEPDYHLSSEFEIVVQLAVVIAFVLARMPQPKVEEIVRDAVLPQMRYAEVAQDAGAALHTLRLGQPCRFPSFLASAMPRSLEFTDEQCN